MNVKYSTVLTKRRGLGAFRLSEVGRLRRRGTERCQGRWGPLGRGPGVPRLPRKPGREEITAASHQPREALPGAGAQRFAAQSKRELSAPLGQTRWLRPDLAE